MGYRHHIGILDKKIHEQIQHMTYSQLQKWYGDRYVPCYEITKEVHELGKYYDDSFLKKHCVKVFSRQSTHRKFQGDHRFYILTQKGFEAIIDDYRQRVLEYYQLLLKQDKNDLLMNRITPIDKAIEAKIRTWGENCTKYKLFPYSLKGEEITSSWEYEYAVFELVRIYKSVNWDRQYVTITAW